MTSAPKSAISRVGVHGLEDQKERIEVCGPVEEQVVGHAPDTEGRALELVTQSNVRAAEDRTLRVPIVERLLRIDEGDRHARIIRIRLHQLGLSQHDALHHLHRRELLDEPLL